MIQTRKIIKYELLNIARNIWLLGYALLIALMGISLIWIGGSIPKAITSLASIMVALVPLLSLIFSVVYWYYNEKFTELLLTQAIHRRRYLLIRYGVMGLSLGLCTIVGLSLPFVLFGGFNSAVCVLNLVCFLLVQIFVAMGIYIGIVSEDRMKGIGTAMLLWCFFEIAFDGILLFILFQFRDYPLDYISGILGSINPVGLSRVVLLMFNDSSLLLGYSGILIRNVLTSGVGYAVAALWAVLWLVVPSWLAVRAFDRLEIR